MKIKLLVLITSFIAFSCKEVQLSSAPEQINHFNHQIFEEHKLAPRATFFGTESSKIVKKENSKRFLSLNGAWKFHFVKDPKQRPTTFQNTAFDDNNWTTIPVPSNC
jgi:beta-galactosidase